MSKTKLEDIEVTRENLEMIIELLSVCEEKKDVIRKQMYSEAAELRDRERKLIITLNERLGLDITYPTKNLENVIRDLKIKLVLNES